MCRSPFMLLVFLLTLSTQTPSAVRASTPTASQNSEQLIVYQALAGPIDDGIWVAQSDGSNPVELALDTGGSHLHPDWSPDGDRIVFEVQFGEVGTLWTVDANGTDPALLFECVAPCIRTESPAWSPDGTRIAFTSVEDTDGIEGPPDETAIQILDLTAMTVSEVVRTKFPTLMSVPRWSPDGMKLVLSVENLTEDAAYDLGSAIAVVDANGGSLQMLTDPELFAYYPDWNNTGDTIVFDNQALQWAKDSPADPATWNLYSISPDGTGLRQITNADSGNKLWQPSWTPDGERITATMDDPNGRMAVFVDPVSGDVNVIHGRLATHVRLQPTPE